MMRFTALLLIILITGCSSKKFTHRQVPQGDEFVSNQIDSTITLIPGERYDKNFIHKIFFGSHYRKVWGEPVSFRVIDLRTEKGGLTPVKKGGSFQSFTLHMEDADKNDYVLRSVDKDPSKALSAKWQRSLFGGMMRDQTSSSFPYGALVAAEMAEAAGVYHTNPEIVYVPHDSAALGEFYKDFSGTLVLMEERADDNWEHLETFGYSKEIKGTEKMLENIGEKQDKWVDQESYLRARLLDMLIGDWSRREDQWRWAEFEEEGNTIYRPVPRDRDHAFFKFKDGLFTWLAHFAKPNFHHFSPKIKRVKALNNAAGRIDRVLLNELTFDDWQRIAQEFYEEVSEKDIENAVEKLPAAIFELEGEQLIKRLESRRGDILRAATRYYEILSDEVTVQGTDKDEEFIISAISPEEVEVKVVSLKDGKHLYSRKFYANETRKVILLGLGGDDKLKSFIGSGKIDISWHPGAGQEDNDHLAETDECVSNVKAWLTHFYFD